MANRTFEAEKQPEVDPHSYVFRILQSLSELEAAKDRRPVENSAISYEQIKAYKGQNGDRDSTTITETNVVNIIERQLDVRTTCGLCSGN